MYDIKYFFLNKINQTIQERGKKKFGEGKITESITKKHYFSKFRGELSPWYTPDPPLFGSRVRSHPSNSKFDLKGA
jgi:hypothetical protein